MLPRFHDGPRLASGALRLLALFTLVFSAGLPAWAEVVEVAGQPLAANAARLQKALTAIGSPLPEDPALTEAIVDQNSAEIQKRLDPKCLFLVSINPELRVKAQRGEAPARLQQAAATAVLIKVINEGAAATELRLSSPQGGNVFAGSALPILERQAQTDLAGPRDNRVTPGRFLDVSLHAAPPMTRKLSGLAVEYVIALLTSSESGDREATIVFDLGDGTRDLEFRSEVPVLFKVQPAIAVRIEALDEQGQPTTARLTIRDTEGRVYPAQSKRLAPDFFFQPQIYRRSGESVLLPPGEFTVEGSRGPEYLIERTTRQVSHEGDVWKFELKRWIDAAKYGFFSGDHHIHGAGCSHYTSPTEGVTPADMFRQVQGEGLNVGCVLTWGPCFDFQRRYFSPEADLVSEPLTRLKYDLEISGFGSQALGHICLLNLRDQTYPGTDGTSKNWPTWTVPALRWAKAQGGVVGYPHSALRTLPRPAAERLVARLDRNKDSQLSAEEIADTLLPEPWSQIDRDSSGQLSIDELTATCDRRLDEIPNLVIPDLGGGGALEICVSTALGACDFISTMDTARIGEWNTWYHLLNCGFPIKAAGETDFPCMSSRAVGQGRTYVQLGQVKEVDFTAWCEGLKAGRSYTSDGYAHATKFTVNGTSPGTSDVTLKSAATVHVEAAVAFAREQPKAVAYGSLPESVRLRNSGDTVVLHGPRSEEMVVGGTRLVELIVNGQVVARKPVPADNQIHHVEFDVPIPRSSWVAVRQFPQLHTNPVDVIVDRRPIRASRSSALWCRETVRALWDVRNRFIAEPERAAARAAYDEAMDRFQSIAGEAPEGS
jgi:hypothetical protein